MSERLPGEKEDKMLQILEEVRRNRDAGLELQRKDNEDPERGPIVQQVRAVMSAANKNYSENPLYNELLSFQKSFLEHFGKSEAQSYRLFHASLGSTPPGNADLFDAEGEWSIAQAMQNLAEKYRVSYTDAKAA